MSPEVNAQAWLEAYAHTYLWVDDDWIDVGEQTFTYWQARLAQTTTIDVLADGRAKWRVRTRIVDNVGAAETATQLCFALNSYAAGWSFAYDGESRSVDAIIAMCAPLDFDTWQLRLSETAKLSAWMSDVIAQRLADVVSGSPAFSHPARQSAVRETFDGTYYYLETLRGRPERVLDTTARLYPGLPQLAREFARLIGAGDEQVVVDDDVIHIGIEDTGVELQASFADHPIVGECWHTAVRFPCLVSNDTAAFASAMAWHLFDDEESILLGGWISRNGDLVFAQWSTISELRNQESLPSNRDRPSDEVHGGGDLWGLTSAVNGPIHLTLETATAHGQAIEQVEEVARSAAAVIAAISDIARPALDIIPTERGEQADRRLLWMERKYVLAAAAWFNPIGPSVSTLEVCSLPDRDEDYLLYFLRHPFSPDFRVVSPIGPGDDLAAATQDGVGMFQGGSLPHTLMIFDAPHAISSRLQETFREQIIEASRTNGIDLSAQAKKLADAAGNPWALAPHNELPDSTSASAAESPPSHVDPAAMYDEWFEQVSNPANAGAIFAQLPDAWDGALNFQLSAGDIRFFDVGPLPIRYSSIGTMEK